MSITTPFHLHDVSHKRTEPDAETCWHDAQEFGHIPPPPAIPDATGVFAGCWIPAPKVTPVHYAQLLELEPWFKSLAARNGYPCCDGTDAKRVPDVDWDTSCEDGTCHYRVRLYDKWWAVPDSAVVDGPNLAHIPLIWLAPQSEEQARARLAIRCFKPGAGL